ncbi:MAG: DUF4382 domain-containing protein [Terracidiphilus sp.]|jgi:hypothetical protein
MHKTVPFLFAPALIVALLAGCSSGSLISTAAPAAGSVPVSITMTDDPPAGVSVLFFQVSLTAATLTPSSGSPVSLLSNNTPIQIDVTQLQALSAFLSTANVPAGTYTGLNLTFADPQLVIFNKSDTSLGSTCAVGTICKLTPAFDNNSSSLSFTSSPFPAAVSASSPLGFLIDFHLNTVIQPDLSVNLAATNGVTIGELPQTPSTPHFGFLAGTVQTVSASNNQFTLQTAWGRTFTIDTTSTTAFNNFPTSACTTAGIACLAQGQIVKVEIASVGSNGELTASQVKYVQAATAETVEGTIVKLTGGSSSTPPTGVTLILRWSPASDARIPMGGEATVTLASNATFSIDSNGFTIPSGLGFTGASNLAVGQNVKATIQSGTLSTTGSGPAPNAWGPPPSVTFTASAVALEPSQMTGTVSGTDSSTTSFTLGVGGGSFFCPWPMASTNASSFDVVTTSQTTYKGFNPESFNGLAKGDFVSVNGWLFPPAASGGSPTIAAQSVVMRSGFWF